MSPSVLYLIDSLAPGGAERSLVDMAPGIVSEGVSIEVAVLHDRPGLAPELAGAGIRVHVVGGGSRVAWLNGFIHLLRSRRPDLVHTTLFESDLVGRTAAAATRIPVVSTLANTPYGPDHAAEAGVSRVRLGGARFADAATSRLVSRFHAVSESAADAYVRRLGIPRSKIEVIYRGRSLARMGSPSSERRQQVRARLGIERDTKLLLAVARQEPQKGIDVLLRAVPQIRQFVPGVVVVVAGREGRATPDLERLRSTLPDPDAVRFIGARDDIPDLLCAADLFVLPSHREGLPGSVLEAMAMEVPIVATDLPTTREAVPGDEFALLVTPGDPDQLADAARATLEDIEQSLARTRRSRARFERRFDIDSVGRAMADFYRRALSRD